MKFVLFISYYFFQNTELSTIDTKIFKMSYTITFSTKIFTSAIAPVLFISVGVFFDYPLLPDLFLR